MASDHVNPSKIMQVGSGFFATKTLLSAVELGLFTALAREPKTGSALQGQLGLHPRAAADFLDALVALGFLERDGKSMSGSYRNAPDTDLFLDRNKPQYIGGILEMMNHRLYGFWGNLTEALKTGQPQNEAKSGGDLFGTLYADEARLEGFLRAMSGIQMGPFMALSQAFDFSKHQSVCDVGGASGALSMVLARAYPKLTLTTFDLPPVAPIAKRNVSAAGLGERINVASGDFFKDALPKADVLTLGNVLHDWGTEQKLHILRAAYAALPPGGVLIAIENVIDDERNKNAFGLLMSLNMLIETPHGFDYTAADFSGWAQSVGFKDTQLLPLVGPASALVAYK
ncbi:MAG TPA: methyltransferase [Polyangiaceae bacterium]|nr:methyltransferase [Polyangiaceae bacterium]